MEEYRTSDMGTAAALLLKRYNYIGIDKSNPRAEFIFEKSPELEDTVVQYVSDQLLLPANSFYLSIRRMKGLLYDSPSTS